MEEFDATTAFVRDGYIPCLFVVCVDIHLLSPSNQSSPLGRVRMSHSYLLHHAPDFVPSFLSPFQVLAVYLSAVCAVLLPSWYLTGCMKALGKGERTLACGMVALGLNHLIVEAYFLLTPHYYQASSSMLLPEIWKLYSLADSRYIVRAPSIMGIEGVLVLVLGPMSLLSIYGILAKKLWLHPLMVVYCTTEVMMTISLFLASWFGKEPHSVDLFHFWFYYVFFNVLYGIAIPIIIGVTSLKKINHAIDLYSRGLLEKPTKALN